MEVELAVECRGTVLVGDILTLVGDILTLVVRVAVEVVKDVTVSTIV